MISSLKRNSLAFICCCWLLLAGCSGGKYIIPDRSWQPYPLQPVVFTRHLYSCQINGSIGIRKYSLSGLLLVKHMEDGSKRAVFQNEIGFTFFDFEWDTAGIFRVIQIQEKMNKEALIKTLRKDFEVLFQIRFSSPQINNSRTLIRTQLPKGNALYELRDEHKKNIYILDEREKKVVSMTTDTGKSLPDLYQTMHINHHKANFEINLKTIPTSND